MRKSKKKKKKLIIATDTEGHDTNTGEHLLTYAAAVDEDGNLVAEARNKEGLSHDECMNFLLSLPKDALIFGFSMGYDFTKMLESMPPHVLYELARPEVRKMRTCRETTCKKKWCLETQPVCPRCGGEDYFETFQPVRYKGRSYGWSPFSVADSWYDPKSDDTHASIVAAQAAGFFRAGFRHPRFGEGTFVEALPLLDRAGSPFIKGRFGCTIKQLAASVLATKQGKFVPPKRKRGPKKGYQRRVKVWDCFKFFQQSFVKALESWDIGTPEERAEIEEMKLQRGRFKDISDDRKEKYCQNECRLLAQMMRKLVDAHDEVGLTLKRYDSPGSTAAVLLSQHEVDSFAGPRIEKMPKGLAHAIMSGYFGGRFETSCIGEVKQKIYGRDINSAYPFALFFLPCLSCGLWKRVTGNRRIEKALRGSSAAICRFRVKSLPDERLREVAWAPLPCRTPEGSICFGTNFEGWAWSQELIPALKGWPELVELAGEAWIYRTSCVHRPFGWMPERYKQRCEWGSSGKGLVMKNGCNSVYGKLAQSVGKEPRFQQWAWAGMCTATTRGQMLEALLTLKPSERWHVRSIATDGLLTTKQLVLPKPKPTGTDGCVNEKGKPKTLGDWDNEELEDGVLLIKPGMHIPIDSKLKAKIRARGVGRRELEKHRDSFFKAWKMWDRKTYDKPLVPVAQRKFFGMKGSVHAMSGCDVCGTSWPGHPSKCCPNERCPAFGQGGTRYRAGFMGHRPACSKECERRATKQKQAGEYPVGCGKILTEKVNGEDYHWKCMQPLLGTWAPVTAGVQFEPLPKRQRVVDQEGDWSKLYVRDLGGIVSQAYDGRTTTPEGLESRSARDLDLEQEDAGLDQDEWV